MPGVLSKHTGGRVLAMRQMLAHPGPFACLNLFYFVHTLLHPLTLANPAQILTPTSHCCFASSGGRIGSAPLVAICSQLEPMPNHVPPRPAPAYKAGRLPAFTSHHCSGVGCWFGSILRPERAFPRPAPA
eukprot:1142168-Pelagomonas_calceolata.AAC.5